MRSFLYAAACALLAAVAIAPPVLAATSPAPVLTVEGVLPPAIRDRLWPFLEDPRPSRRKTGRGRDEILADLLRSNASIMVNLKELQQREESTTTTKP